MGRTRFTTLGTVTIGAVYFLILVGGIVRASGAGMGCPDWPKCFGRWVPPTAESQLPQDYQQTYADRGYGETRFNVVKTWTEYINRLIGVVIGLLILAVMLSSLRFWSSDQMLVMLSVAAFVLVAFQGWLGSVVVSTNLAPWMVTVHMAVALFIVFLLIYAVARAIRTETAASEARRSRWVDWLLPSCLLLSGVQIVLGTQVREQLDHVAERLAARSEWIAELGALLAVHRSFSLLVLVANVALYLALRRAGARRGWLGRVTAGLAVVVLAEILAGAALYYFSVPAWLQPVHLLLASLMAGLQFGLWTLYLSIPRGELAGSLGKTASRELVSSRA